MRSTAMWAALAWIASGMTLAGSSPAHAGAPHSPGVPVLIYHEIVTNGRTPGETVIPLARFAAQMSYLAQHGYTPVDLDALTRFMRSGGNLPERAVVLTFDDGWKNVLNAVPVLDRYGFKASFWIISGPRGIGGDYLSWPDIERLAAHAGFEVESHTVSHPWDPRDNLVTWVEGHVAHRGLEDARRELVDSRRTLEAHVHRPVRYLAWPCGWYDATLVALARSAGYRGLLTTEGGMNRPGDSPLAIRRVFVDGSCGLDSFAATLRDGRQRYCGSEPPALQAHLPYARSAAAPATTSLTLPVAARSH